MLATLCGAVASDEGRHEIAYSRIVSKLFEMCAFLRRLHTMPAELCRIGYHCIHTVCTSHHMTFGHMSWSCMRCLGPSVLCAVATSGSRVGGSHSEHRTKPSLLACQRHCTEVAAASCFAQGAQRHRAGSRGDDEAVSDADNLILTFLLLPAARDPSGTMLAFEEMMKKSIVMPAHLMDDNEHQAKNGRNLFADFSEVAQVRWLGSMLLTGCHRRLAKCSGLINLAGCKAHEQLYSQ